MAKKSAKSKGYRKTAAKKPYLNKRDIIILCALLAVVAVGAILLFSYDDGGLKTRGGKIVDAGENWLIVNGAVGNGTRYYKLAEVGELADYTLESEPMPTDENLRLFRYTPEDPSGAVRSITVAGNAASAERQVQYYASLLSEFSPTDPATDTAGDLTYTYFTYSNAALLDSDESAATDDEGEAEPAGDAAADGEGEGETEAADEAGEAEAPEAERYELGFNLYVDAPEHGAVSVSIVCDADSAEALPTEEALKATAAQVLSAIQFEMKPQ